MDDFIKAFEATTEDQFIDFSGFDIIQIIDHYKINNKEKFGGDIVNIPIYVDFEMPFIEDLDTNPDILYWTYNTIQIEYIDPVSKETCEFCPNYYIVTTPENDKIDKADVTLIDIDTFEFYDAPQLTNEDSDGLDEYELKYYGDIIYQQQLNKIKYQATKRYCDRRNMSFLILTKTGLFMPIMDDISQIKLN